ncbi:MAG: succinate dehydrogenase iron-sulfur subunit [Dehalococcoidia bacterium]
MQATIKVQRFNPEAEKSQPYWQEYQLEIEDYATVLDALIKTREEVDGTLALRCSCRSAICGSCAMRINGHAALACKTKLATMAQDGQTVTVEPMGNQPLIKDLVVELAPFWNKVRAVEPWLQPQGPEPEGEYLASNEAMLDLAGVMNCIMCGACVSDCTVLEVDPNFLGPAALAKAYRFVGDPRDSQDQERLKALNEYTGIWDCTRCFECVQVCPKGVAPMERIMALRDKAMEAGYTKSYGARHAEAFAEIVEHSGRLDELRIPIKTFGMLNVPKMLNLMPTGLRALARGKMPPIIHKPIPGAEKVRRIFKKVEEDQAKG